MKCLFVDTGAWNWEGTIFCGGTIEQFIKLMNKEPDVEQLDVDDYKGVSGLTIFEPGVPWSFWVDSIDNFPTIAHEALHVTIQMLRNRGVKLNNGSEEVYTYTMTHILRQVGEAPKGKWKKVNV